MRDVYLSNDRWGALLVSLTALDPNQLPAGRIDVSDYVMALGEAGIWPESVLDDPGNSSRSEGVAIWRDSGCVGGLSAEDAARWALIDMVGKFGLEPDSAAA